MNFEAINRGHLSKGVVRVCSKSSMHRWEKKPTLVICGTLSKKILILKKFCDPSLMLQVASVIMLILL